MNHRKSIGELYRLNTFEERFRYLQLNGSVGKETFGVERVFNQALYHSAEWKRARRDVILRDNGCDLGMEDRPIMGGITIHHLNPVTLRDIESHSDILFDPDNLVCVSHNTHNAIHYGDDSLLVVLPPDRTKNDTCPWRHD